MPHSSSPFLKLPDAAPPVRLRVLIVASDPDMRLYLADCLSSRYQLHEVRDGRAALTFLRQRTVDAVVITDAVARRHGWAFHETLRSDARWALLPLLVLTSDDPPSPGTLPTHSAVLAIPFNADVLVAHLAELLAQADRKTVTPAR